VIVSNVLSDEKRNQIIALGQLGWSLRRIENKTGVRQKAAAGYLKAGGIAELQRSPRSLRLGGRAAGWRRACIRHRPNQWRPVICWRSGE
jgi:predicted DNA-binding transcriptional regulator AlpA